MAELVYSIQQDLSLTLEKKFLLLLKSSKSKVFRTKGNYPKCLCDYWRHIFRFDFWNKDVCFFVWMYDMKQFKLQVEKCFALFPTNGYI